METTINGLKFTIEFDGQGVRRWQKNGKDRLYLDRGGYIDLKDIDDLQASHANIANGMWACDPIIDLVSREFIGRRTWTSRGHGSYVEVRWSEKKPEILLSVKQAALAIGKSQSTVYRWIKSGKLAAEKVAGKLQIKMSDLDK